MYVKYVCYVLLCYVCLYVGNVVVYVMYVCMYVMYVCMYECMYGCM